jgi:hypothetical protein
MPYQMINQWEDYDVDETFRVGEWAVVPTERFRAIESSASAYLVSHECEKSKARSDEPWVWGDELEFPCPDCGVTCPEAVVTVWEMMR